MQNFLKFSIVFLCAFILSACAATSQPPIPSGQRINLEKNSDGFQYSEIVNQTGTAKELYDSALVWVTRNYVSANDVIQLNDRENNQLIVKGSFTGSYITSKIWIPHTLEIRTKDGRYQIRYNNFRYTNTPIDNGISFLDAFNNSGISEKSIVSQAEDSISRSLIDLKSYMASAKEEANW
ncbi:DUF4468 domain-containing protein [Rheinheimera sp. D18]|uniref:DUF4468 domain-containing protein n=1 Tax=Rheinheimera sp. D18 TaxID=2545632 RepID=UPI00104CC5C2|nr:DUF4468 domain-containing protein [Rheinheimera sp. D18]QBL08569.1 DUF4468 domain-containing protein [Rheinheimera sp. D18]